MSQTHLAAEAPTKTPFAVWMVLIVVLIADIMDLLDASVTNIAAPIMVKELGGGQSLISWLGASYALALGSLLVLGGRLGDRFGQRRMFLTGLIGFMLASLAVGIAPNAGLILAARALQGAFGAFLIPQGMAIMVKSFPGNMLRTAFSMFGPLLGAATAGGPVLAGFLIHANIAGLTWRPIFLLNIILGLIALGLALKYLPSVEADTSVRFDPFSAVSLGLGIFALMFGLTRGSEGAWNFLTVALLVVGLVLLLAFARRQTTSADPLLAPSLFKNRGFVSGLLVGLVFFGACTGLVYVLSLFVQQILGFDSLHAAYAMLPLMIGLIIASFSCMTLIDRLGRKLVVVGFGLSIGGIVLLALVVQLSGDATTMWQLTAPLVVIGAGMGAGFGTIFNIALGNIAEQEAGSASGSLEAVQQLAGGAGSALVSALFLSFTASGGVHALFMVLVVLGVLLIVALPLIKLMPIAGQADLH